LPPPEALADRVPLLEEKKRARRKCICVVIRRNTSVKVGREHSFCWSTDCVVGLLSLRISEYFKQK
jgi:hypothetical protein